MAQAEQTDRSLAAGDPQAPSVLVVLVVKDGEAWLRDCLAGLAAQTYSRYGVIAVDNASSDGSRELLTKALGDARVLALARSPGLGAAVSAALEREAAREADYILILHDDTVLEPDAIERLVESARGIDEVEGVGVVGPKVVDWDDPHVLREVGSSSDRFGHPYSPLEANEIDHGQYDRIREVLFTSSCAMLVSREAWMRAGLPDERLGWRYEDLDFGWRVRLAGFRVLWSPTAVARHRDADLRGERHRHPDSERKRFYEERAGFASILKDYRFPTLLWIVPVSILFGLGRLIGLGVSRRFEEAYQLLAAWGWNFVHFPGTLRRRLRAQSKRAVRDREIRRYMTHGSVRFRRWLDVAGRVLPGEVEVPDDDDPFQRTAAPRSRAVSLIREHPVAAAWIVVAVISAFAFRHFVGPEPLTGGVAPVFPSTPTDFFRELLSGVRTTPIGGAQAASPALAALGGLSGVLFGSTGVAEKALFAALPIAGGMAMYRLLLRMTANRAASLIAAGCYGLSAVALWSFSNGRLAALVTLAILPRIADRLGIAFGEGSAGRRLRFFVGTGAFLAVGIAFDPGIVLAAAVLFVVFFLSPERERRRFEGVLLALGFFVVAVLLVFPQVAELVLGGGDGLSSPAGQANFGALSRLVLGPGQGSWTVSWFLPIAAVMCFALVRRSLRQASLRYLFSAVAALFLAWGSAAGYLPQPLSNPGAYIAVLAISYCVLVGLGLATVFGGIERQAFGVRQVLAVLATILVVAGVSLEGLLATGAGWAIGPDKQPAAWPVVADAPGAFRVLWIGQQPGNAFPAPGGDPERVFAGGAQNTVRYSITSQDGTSALDIGRDAQGDGFGYVDTVMNELLSGTSHHVGALLAPLGVQYIVSGSGAVSQPVLGHLDDQADLSRIPADGLIIYRNERQLPLAALYTQAEYVHAADTGSLTDLSALPPAEAEALQAVTGGYDGKNAAPGSVWIADQFAPGWQLRLGGRNIAAEKLFGWQNGFTIDSGAGPFTIRYTDQWIRDAEMAALAALWLVALWVTRKPVRK